MAKSLRSKWRRKCKAVKRERYGAKELARLKKTLGIDENAPKEVEMSEISEIATVVDAKTVKEKAQNKDKASDADSMEVEGGRVYDKKTLRDQYGNYPVWMHRRKIIKYKKGRAKSEKSQAKPSKRLTRKQKKSVKQKGNKKETLTV